MAAELKMADEELASIQAFMLNLVGPLMWVLKMTEDDPDDPGITVKEAKSALADAIKLLGNASA